MSKSIYEEALKELTWLLHDEFDDNPKRSRLNVSQRLDMFKKVKDTLEQEQKQEKLLELYRELSKLKDDVICLVMFGKDYEHLRVKTVEIEQQIEELDK